MKKNQKKTPREWLAKMANRLAPPVEAGTPMSMPPSAKGDTAFRLSGILTLGIALLVLVFAALLASRAYGVLGMGSNGEKNRPIVYLQNGSVLKFSHPYLDAPVTITEDFDTGSITNPQLSQQALLVAPSGKKLLYFNHLVDGVGELYLRDISREKPGYNAPDSKGLRLASNVLWGSASFLQGEDEAVYLKKPEQGEGFNLCHWNRRDGETQLDVGVEQMAPLLPGDRLCYVALENGQRTLRSIDFSEKKADRIIQQTGDSGVIILLVHGKAADRVFYQVQNPSKQYDVKSWNGKDDPVALALDVAHVIDVGPRGELFYTRTVEKEFDPMTLFEDDMAIPDLLLKEPIQEDFMVEKKGLWGKVTKTLDQKAYDDAVADYAEKQVRDEIRKTIKNQSQKYLTYTLCHTVGSSQTEVDNNLRQVEAADVEAATTVYYKTQLALGEKFQISSFADAQEALRMVKAILGNTTQEYYYARLGTEPTMFQTVPKSEQLMVVLDGARGLYFTRGVADDPAENLLYYAGAESDGLGSVKKLDDRVLRLDDCRYREQILYLRQAGSGIADLCGLSAGKKTVLVSGISPDWGYSIQSDTLGAMKKFDTDRATGELTLYSGKERYLGGDINDYSYRTDDFVYLLQNYDSTNQIGTLCLYTGNSTRLLLVDRDVSFISEGSGWRMAEAGA